MATTTTFAVGPASPQILLRPSKRSLLLLLPLLPPAHHPPALVTLPAESWFRCIEFAMDISKDIRPGMNQRERERLERFRRDIVLVCKSFKNLATPILYSRVTIKGLAPFSSFHQTLSKAEQQWDSLRRIPYSSPGRWVQSLDFSGLQYAQSTRLKIDNLFTTLFPLTPFLIRLVLNPKIVLSRRAMISLGDSCGHGLRAIKGLGTNEVTHARWDIDPLTSLVASCPCLEELEVIGEGMYEDPDESDPRTPPLPLNLYFLVKLTLIGIPLSPLLPALSQTRLPALRILIISSYHTSDAAPTTVFLKSAGPTLTSIRLVPPPDWPTPGETAPPTLLSTTPNLTDLWLSSPLPRLLPPEGSTPHPLRTLSIPRPTPEFLRCIEDLPKLERVFIREVKWLNGLTRGAALAGAAGEMTRWRKMLPKRIKIIDSVGRLG